MLLQDVPDRAMTTACTGAGGGEGGKGGKGVMGGVDGASPKNENMLGVNVNRELCAVQFERVKLGVLSQVPPQTRRPKPGL
jgi:hypothetical protein